MSRVLTNDVKLIFTGAIGVQAGQARAARLSSRSSSLLRKKSLFNPCTPANIFHPSETTAERFSLWQALVTRPVSTSRLAAEQTDYIPSAQNEAPDPPLAIVFTDIVKSTVIWEKDSSTMAVAMRIHDGLVRQLSLAHGGYEVKQNGDGFMIAFQSAVAALKFCLQVQIKLQDQPWPEALDDFAPTKPIITDPRAKDGQSDQTLLWKGLRLRMSIHFGDPMCNWNEVIGRMDYLGPAVNRAARFIGVCEAGQIVVSQDFFQELKNNPRNDTSGNGPLFDDVEADCIPFQELDLRDFQSGEIGDGGIENEFEVRLLGDRHFKGVPENQRLYVIVPKALRARLDFFPQHQYVQASKGNLPENG